ncbi:MAG TPA: dephospho-CoA kinase [Thermoanaerobaculia bacterium]
MTLRVGLTGGIASGKSTILALFARFGCWTLDADKLVAELYRPGQPGHAALIRTYGERILRPDGEVDRVALANIAFATPGDARKLNALIHPIVIEETERRLATVQEEIAVVEATLLLEAGGRQRYDRIVVIDVDPAVQIERGVARGMAEEEVRRRLANQMPREERLRHADYVIDNSGDLAQAERETARVVEALRQDAPANRDR